MNSAIEAKIIELGEVSTDVLRLYGDADLSSERMAFFIVQDDTGVHLRCNDRDTMLRLWTIYRAQSRAKDAKPKLRLTHVNDGAR